LLLPRKKRFDATLNPAAANKKRRDFVIGVVAAIGMPLSSWRHLRRYLHVHRGRRHRSLYALLIGWLLFRRFTLKSVFNDFTNTGMSIGSLMIPVPDDLHNFPVFLFSSRFRAR
jgi:hypothetical protein